MAQLLASYRDGMRSLSKNVRLYLLAITLSSISMGMFSTLFNLYLQGLGYPKAFMGELVSTSSLAAAIILIPAGIFSDRIGRKWSMVIGLGIAGIGQVGRALAEGQQTLIGLTFIVGLFNALSMVANAPFLAENTTKEERMQLFSINFALMTFSSMLGNIIGGALPSLLSTAGVAVIWAQKITLLVAAAATFGAALPILSIHEHRPAAPSQARKSEKVQWGDYLLIGKFIFAQGLVGFGAGLFVPFSNVYFENRFHLNTSVVGLIMSAGQLTTVIATLLGPFLVQRIGRIGTVFTLQILSIPFMITLGDTPWLWVAVGAYLMRGAIMNAANPITSSFMMEAVSDKVKGLANSASQMVFQLGWAVCGRLSGQIIDRYGYGRIFYLAGLLYATSAIYYFVMFRGLDRRLVQTAKQELSA